VNTPRASGDADPGHSPSPEKSGNRGTASKNAGLEIGTRALPCVAPTHGGVQGPHVRPQAVLKEKDNGGTVPWTPTLPACLPALAHVSMRSSMLSSRLITGLSSRHELPG